MKDSPSYGVLWADADEAVVDGGASENRQGWWWNEGVSLRKNQVVMISQIQKICNPMAIRSNGDNLSALC